MIVSPVKFSSRLGRTRAYFRCPIVSIEAFHLHRPFRRIVNSDPTFDRLVCTCFSMVNLLRVSLRVDTEEGVHPGNGYVEQTRERRESKGGVLVKMSRLLYLKFKLTRVLRKRSDMVC